jgi:hypothetical protein
MQFRHFVVPSSDWYNPFLQTSHSVSRATTEEDLPGGHKSHWISVVLDWYIPGMQFRHFVVPSSDWYNPFLQTSHSVSRATTEEDLPGGHKSHWISVILDWYIPGIHFKQLNIPFAGWT